MNGHGALALAGDLHLHVVRGAQVERSRVPDRVLTHRDVVEYGLPHSGVSPEVRQYRTTNARHLLRGWRRVAMARALHLPQIYGTLSLLHVAGDGTKTDLGLVSMRVVTNAGVAYIVDAFQNLTELENLKFHGFGTGTNAEAAADTALQTELTTQYATDNVRPTGTTTEAAANVFVTVATFAPDSGGTIAVTEHGIFSQAATGGGTLFDRSVFSAVNVVAAADSIVATYSLTLTAGS